MKIILTLMLTLCACQPAAIYVRDVKLAPSGALIVTHCEMDRDFWGKPVEGKCHTEKNAP